MDFIDQLLDENMKEYDEKARTDHVKFRYGIINRLLKAITEERRTYFNFQQENGYDKNDSFGRWVNHNDSFPGWLNDIGGRINNWKCEEDKLQQENLWGDEFRKDMPN